MVCDWGGGGGSQEQWNINGMMGQLNFIYTKKHLLVYIGEGNLWHQVGFFYFTQTHQV